MMKSLVRRSCEAFVTSDTCSAAIHEDKIHEFIIGIDQKSYRRILEAEQAQLSFPLNFGSLNEKLNFYAILHLLNFGSGYRSQLKATTGCGAFENIIKLLISFHLSGEALDANWMSNITSITVGELMRIPMTTEKPIDNIACLTQVIPSKLSELAAKIAEALNTTGRHLIQSGHNSLIQYIKAAINSSKDVDAIFITLAAIPTLADEYMIGEKVYIYKKMQVMLSELQRQGLTIPQIQADSLTVFSDNVLPTMLQYYGLISCPSADESLKQEQQISLEQAVSLRAAAIVICHKIVETAATMDGHDWIGNEVDLDNYLWKVAKEENLRILPRYSFQDTWFF